MLEIVMAAILVFNRSGQYVGVLLETVQCDNRHCVERGVATLRESTDATYLAEAVVKVGLCFTGRYPRVIGQIVLTLSHFKIIRLHDREPEARLGANRAVAA